MANVIDNEKQWLELLEKEMDAVLESMGIQSHKMGHTRNENWDDDFFNEREQLFDCWD